MYLTMIFQNQLDCRFAISLDSYLSFELLGFRSNETCSKSLVIKGKFIFEFVICFVANTRQVWIHAEATFDMLIHANTLKPRQNGRHFLDNIVKCIFWNENVKFRYDLFGVVSQG